MDLSILIINWNSAHYLKPCLSSVFRETKGIEYEVIVVDNASYDGSADIVKNEFPQVKFVQSDENLGFIRGNNLAFRYATGKTILLLNADTEVISGALTTLYSSLQAIPDAGVISGRLLASDGTVQLNCVQPFPTIWNQFLDSDFLRRLFPKSSLWGMTPLLERPAEPVVVEVVCGACLMIKRDLFQQVGLLSDDYLMYGDDHDLCYKVKKAGYKVYHSGQAEVIHYGGKSTESWKEALADTWIKDSANKFMVKTRGRWYGRMHKATMALQAVSRLAIISCVRMLPRDAEGKRRMAYAFAKWKGILKWAIGMKEWAKSASKEIGLSQSQW
jgi:GT2 family glycosyltransferase